MKVDLDNRQSDVQIEILPMLDVVFCILTFFILAAVGLTKQQAIELDLPAVNQSSAVEGNERERLYVSVDSAGQVYVDKSAVPLGLLYDVLVQHKAQAPNGTIVLYASRSARYEDVVKVLDLLRTVGGDRVALATLPNDTSLDPTQNRSLEDVLRDQGVQISPGGSSPGIGSPGIGSPGTTPGAGSSGNPNGIQITPAPGSSGGSPSGSSAFPGSTLPPLTPGTSTAPGSAPVAPALP
ncbi:MAG: biopolymer transporter ExbD [Cyanobacteria bacterium P01_F01_bin.53]